MTERSDMDLPDGGKSYKLVAEVAESTVVAEYEPSHGRETAYQSEADLEEELLRIRQISAVRLLRLFLLYVGVLVLWICVDRVQEVLSASSMAYGRTAGILH